MNGSVARVAIRHLEARGSRGLGLAVQGLGFRVQGSGFLGPPILFCIHVYIRICLKKMFTYMLLYMPTYMFTCMYM